MPGHYRIHCSIQHRRSPIDIKTNTTPQDQHKAQTMLRKLPLITIRSSISMTKTPSQQATIKLRRDLPRSGQQQAGQQRPSPQTNIILLPCLQLAQKVASRKDRQGTQNNKQSTKQQPHLYHVQCSRRKRSEHLFPLYYETSIDFQHLITCEC